MLNNLLSFWRIIEDNINKFVFRVKFCMENNYHPFCQCILEYYGHNMRSLFVFVNVSLSVMMSLSTELVWRGKDSSL